MSSRARACFAAQAKAAPRRAFPYKLFGLDVLIDADGKPWLIEAQRKPALGGNALVRKVNGQMFQTIFEMSCGYVDRRRHAGRAHRPDSPRIAPRNVAARVRNRGRAQGPVRARRMKPRPAAEFRARGPHRESASPQPVPQTTYDAARAPAAGRRRRAG